MLNLTKRLIKKTFNVAGMDVIRKTNSPDHTLLGIKKLPIHTIFDIGANQGQFAEMISRIFPDSNIYCFEPAPDPFKKLSSWAENKKDKISVYNVALGDREGDAEIYVHSEHDPSSSLLKTSDECLRLYPFTKKQFTAPIKVRTLDSMVDDSLRGVIPEILVKIDVQGYEAHVIRGGVETLRKSKVCILEVALVELYENQATFKDILVLLNDLGFQYSGNLEQVYDNDGRVIYIDALFIK